MSDNVIYRPGEEPENIRKRLDTLFAKLDSAYPDKVIVGLNKDHKHWGESVTDLYRKLGYESGKAFLFAYGYNAEGGKGGRAASVDPASIIAQLKEKYPEGTTLTIAELKNANPEIPWKSLANKANEYFGTTLAKQLFCLLLFFSFLYSALILSHQSEYCLSSSSLLSAPSESWRNSNEYLPSFQFLR